MRNYCGIDSHETGCNCVSNEPIWFCRKEFDNDFEQFKKALMSVAPVFDPNQKIRNRMLNFLFSQREYEWKFDESKSTAYNIQNNPVMKPYDYGSNYHRQSIMNYLTNKHYA